jgi:hypothetical protein
MWSRGALPAFDGLITSFLSGSAAKVLKGVAVLLLFVLALALLYRSLRTQFWLGVAVCTSTLAMTAVLNQHEVWAVVRFGRVLLIPVAYFSIRASGAPAYWIFHALMIAVVLGVVTNFGFAAYMACHAAG